MLKFLLILADELDKRDKIKIANALDTIVEKIIKESKITINIPVHGDTGEVYHKWLELPENWNNFDLVSYLVKIKNKEVMSGVYNGLEFRNCNVCGNTLTKKHKEE